MVALAWKDLGSLDSLLSYAAFDSRVERHVGGRYVLRPLILDSVVHFMQHPASRMGRL